MRLVGAIEKLRQPPRPSDSPMAADWNGSERVVSPPPPHHTGSSYQPWLEPSAPPALRTPPAAASIHGLRPVRDCLRRGLPRHPLPGHLHRCVFEVGWAGVSAYPPARTAARLRPDPLDRSILSPRSWPDPTQFTARTIRRTACGLYYAAELAEEYASASKRVIAWSLAIVIGMHAALLVEKFPVPVLAGGIGCHLVYAWLLSDFPNVEVFSMKFGLSLCEFLPIFDCRIFGVELACLRACVLARVRQGRQRSSLIHPTPPPAFHSHTDAWTQARCVRTTCCGSSTSTPAPCLCATSSTPWCVGGTLGDRRLLCLSSVSL